ncbi:ParB family chromosome partitioning protein [Pedobacter africanus]|uniref:ParB/RepB/Spo0J family partition protein n=1 Tax=Pedobacter africanus TaxID=151894 RepID=UPI0033966E58
MSTKTSNKKQSKPSAKKNLNLKYDLNPFNTEGTPIEVSPEQVDIGPLNYRKIFNEKDLQDFAADLALHGVIHAIVVRKMPSGRLELVVGERRLRAARIAGLKAIPAVVRLLTDEQVEELMLAENLQRENPHPLHEAQGIERLYKAQKPIDEIAARLGKSKSFVYSRLKWAELILPLQEIFLADLLGVKEVNDLAFLSADSQQEFFNQYCADWQEPDFQLGNIRQAITQYKYDLKKAPFDTGDKTLLPDAGACTHCPFNSATLKTLFPEMATHATCTHKVCYKSKCTAHIQRSIAAVIAQHQPVALVVSGHLSEDARMVVDSMPETNALPEHSLYEVYLRYAPAPPEKEDHTYYDEDGEEEFDESSFNIAQQEYEQDLAEYQNKIESGTLTKAVLVKSDGASLAYFSEGGGCTKEKTVTAKDVQQAIKSGTVTHDMLAGEIVRIEAREKRAKEIDRDKVQQQVFDAVEESLKNKDTEFTLTDADLTAARLLIYQSLGWDARNTVQNMLFNGIAHTDNEAFLTALAGLTDGQYAYMIRMALACKSECKIPGQISGASLYKVAEAAGVDVAAIETAQTKKAKEREQKLKPRIADLKKRAKKFKKAA